MRVCAGTSLSVWVRLIIGNRWVLIGVLMAGVEGFDDWGWGMTRVGVRQGLQ